MSLTGLKILIILTSNSNLGNSDAKTGFWVEEFAAPYYVFKDAGVQITLASPKGGRSPIDPNSEKPDAQTKATRRFYEDKMLQDQLSHTLKLEDLNVADYDAVFYPGGHGLLWDLVDDTSSIRLIRDFYESGKPVSFVCHAPAALKNVKTKEGVYLVKGKKVTGFTNEEEAAVGLSKKVPFLLEDMLKEHGGIYEKGKEWSVHVVQDGNLITGQNPASSEKVAEKVLQSLHVIR